MGHKRNASVCTSAPAKSLTPVHYITLARRPHASELGAIQYIAEVGFIIILLILITYLFILSHSLKMASSKPKHVAMFS